MSNTVKPTEKKIQVCTSISKKAYNYLTKVAVKEKLSFSQCVANIIEKEVG